MAVLADGSAESLHPFVTGAVEPGSTVITDAWKGYSGLDGLGYTHERRSQRAARARGDDPGELLPAVHRVASLAKRWLLGTHQGSVDEAHLPAYLNEFAFRFNRRRSRSRGMVFYRVMELAAGHEPVRFQDLLASKKPRPAPAARGWGHPPSLERPAANRPWRTGELQMQLPIPLRLTEYPRSTNTALSHDVDEVLGTHTVSRAAQLLADLADPGRGFDAVVIGEPQRAFYGNQYSLTMPVFAHYGVELWVPEVGGPIDPDSEAHDLIMSVFGGMSKGERNRIKLRVRAAMAAQAALEGRFLGGRPPYGYRHHRRRAAPEPGQGRRRQAPAQAGTRPRHRLGGPADLRRVPRRARPVRHRRRAHPRPDPLPVPARPGPQPAPHRGRLVQISPSASS